MMTEGRNFTECFILASITVRYCLTNNKQILNLIRSLNHEQTKYETLAERSFVFNLNGTCSSPIGASAKISNEILELNGALASPDGALITKNNISGFYKDAEKLGKDLAIKIINQMKLVTTIFLIRILKSPNTSTKKGMS